MEIKTIQHQLHYAEKFDAEVNDALGLGYRLIRRDIIMPPTPDKKVLLYAELERPDDADLIHAYDPNLWPRLIKATCMTANDCSADGCPLYDWCQANIPDGHAPNGWAVAEEVVDE